MSSSGPGGSRRNSMCHTAARTSPITTSRRENLGVAKNSRMAKRYTMPASVKEDMKYGPPLSPKLREQIVSATHNVAPSMYTLRSGVSLIYYYYNSPVPVRGLVREPVRECPAASSHSLTHRAV